jgi:ADP-ribose pyrophosphatase
VTEPRVTLPAPPKVELETVSDARLGEGGFLTLRRTTLVTITDGKRSEPFAYDAVDRKALDASVVLAHHVSEGRVWVWLRSCLRPPLALRHAGEEEVAAVMWELCAGLVEPGESARAAAARELAEELGFTRDETALLPLGPASCPAPGFIGELHHYFHVEVDPKTRTEPAGDGSPVEAGAVIATVPLDEALAACRRGDLRDAKTELALRRFAEQPGTGTKL